MITVTDKLAIPTFIFHIWVRYCCFTYNYLGSYCCLPSYQCIRYLLLSVFLFCSVAIWIHAQEMQKNTFWVENDFALDNIFYLLASPIQLHSFMLLPRWNSLSLSLFLFVFFDCIFRWSWAYWNPTSGNN